LQNILLLSVLLKCNVIRSSPSIRWVWLSISDYLEYLLIFPSSLFLFQS